MNIIAVVEPIASELYLLYLLVMRRYGVGSVFTFFQPETAVSP